MPSYGALLKQELFFVRQNSSMIYLDTDMLAINSTLFVHGFLHQEPQDQWRLHGSNPNTTADYINSGFMAFRLPAPKVFLESLTYTFKWAVSSHVSSHDQDLINRALCHNNSLSQSNCGSQRMQIHHDWFMNYKPYNGNDMKKWRVLHWSGCDKEWGAPGAFNRDEHPIPEMSESWKTMCISVESKCVDSFRASNMSCGASATTVPPPPQRPIYAWFLDVSVLLCLLVPLPVLLLLWGVVQIRFGRWALLPTGGHSAEHVSDSQPSAAASDARLLT